MNAFSTIFSEANLQSANVAAAIIGVVGIFVGAVLTLLIRRWEVKIDRRHERDRVMAALAAEIQDNLKDIENTFSPTLYTSFPVLIRKVQRVEPFVPLWTYVERSAVYDEHVKDIGRLPANTTTLLIQFYAALRDTYVTIDAFEKPAYLHISPFGRALLVHRIYVQLAEQHTLGREAFRALTGSYPAYKGAVGRIEPPAPPTDVSLK